MSGGPGHGDSRPGVKIGYTLDTYDSSDNLISTTDPLGNTTLYGYTSGGATANGVVAPDNLRYCTIDPVSTPRICDRSHGRLPGLWRHRGRRCHQVFDTTGDVTGSTNPDGGTTLYSYESADNPGLPTQTTDPDGKITTDTYDAQGDILTETVSDTTGSYSATTESAYDELAGNGVKSTPTTMRTDSPVP